MEERSAMEFFKSSQRNMKTDEISAALIRICSSASRLDIASPSTSQPPEGLSSFCPHTVMGNSQLNQFLASRSQPTLPTQLQSPENLSTWLATFSGAQTTDQSSQTCDSFEHEPRMRGIAPYVEAKAKWMERGYQLLKKHYPHATYSVKVFIGGLQYDVTPQMLDRIFKQFGVVRVLKQAREGHAYVIFANSDCVSHLLENCERLVTGEYFYLVGNRKAQVIPWAAEETEWGECIEPEGLPRTNLIFVGGLHGETTAEHLKIIMEDKFGEVQHVVIDTDKYMYPSGSARVQFVFRHSFLRAVRANFLEINTKHYSRSVQLEPFFEKDHQCSRCFLRPSVILCGCYTCLEYFCRECFAQHRLESGIMDRFHRPVCLTTRKT